MNTICLKLKCIKQELFNKLYYTDEERKPESGYLIKINVQSVFMQTKRSLNQTVLKRDRTSSLKIKLLGELRVHEM